MLTWSVLCVLVCALVGTSTAKNWVLIVAGAKGYDNYFSQSTACHSYQTVRKLGVPAENIIHMNYDDVAHNRQNPFKNNLVVLPNGTNMYEGCKIDYKGWEVTAHHFLSILKGDKEALRTSLGREGRVIESGPEDNVFITMVDHGGPGVFYFPVLSPLHNKEFVSTLKEMYSAKKYKKMVIYVESCESGSMFDGLLPNNTNIYGSTCATPNESGWICCFDEKRNTFVGTLYANGWEFDSDNCDPRNETIAQQYEVMKKACVVKEHASHPQQYGDLSINKEVLGLYQGNLSASLHLKEDLKMWEQCKAESQFRKLEFAGIDLINPAMDMVHIATLARRLLQADTNDGQYIAQLQTQLNRALEIKEAAGQLLKDVTKLVLGRPDVDDVIKARTPIMNSVCYKEAMETLTARCPGLDFREYPFIRRNLHTLINLCNIQPLTQIVSGIRMASSHQDMCNVM